MNGDEIWEELVDYFDWIKDALERLKKERGGSLKSEDHQLTIEQVIEKIYEVM